MIVSALQTSSSMPAAASSAGTGPDSGFRMVKSADSRMGGSVPVWDKGAAGNPDAFGFGDLVDMVNPLHHIPVVGHIYRQMTGDEIKPIARLIGGGLFGGPLGAASSMANVIIEHETGQDITASALAFARGDKSAPHQHKPPYKSDWDSPERRLAAAQQMSNPHLAALQNLPGSVLSYADLGQRPPAEPPIAQEESPPAKRKPVNHWANLND